MSAFIEPIHVEVDGIDHVDYGLPFAAFIVTVKDEYGNFKHYGPFKSEDIAWDWSLDNLTDEYFDAMTYGEETLRVDRLQQEAVA
jgi:hypothetical protein